MRWSCLQFNVLLLPESNRHLSAETGGSRYPLPLHGKGASLKKIPNQTPPTQNLIHVSKLASGRGSVSLRVFRNRANINVYSSTRFSGLILEDEMICIPRTAGYVVRNQAESAEDAESKSEHRRKQ